jgi:heme-degrading monooxygenase HmoA
MTQLKSRTMKNPHIRGLGETVLRVKNLAVMMVDWAAGTGMIVTLWETREAMEASERARAARQAATSAATGATVTTERYEVVDWLTL